MPIAWAKLVDNPPVFRFALEGEPVPWGRPRPKGNGYITPEATVSAEMALGVACKIANPGVEPLDGPVAIIIDFYTNIPRNNPRGRGDIDNMTKTVLDGLKGIAWGDDYQVEIQVVTLNPNSSVPGTEVAIYRRE